MECFFFILNNKACNNVAFPSMKLNAFFNNVIAKDFDHNDYIFIIIIEKSRIEHVSIKIEILQIQIEMC